MARNKKSGILNQSSLIEPKEIKEEVVDTTPEEIKEEVVDTTPEEIKEDLSELDGAMKDVPVTEEISEEPVEGIEIEMPDDEESPIYDDDGEVDGEKNDEVEKIPRTIESLSKSELRWFQRTGIMPE